MNRDFFESERGKWFGIIIFFLIIIIGHYITN